MKTVKFLIAAAAFIAVLMLGSFNNSYYNRAATVSSVNGYNITAIDNKGHEWKFEADELKKGDKIIMKMYDGETTEYIQDDEVVDYKMA